MVLHPGCHPQTCLLWPCLSQCPPHSRCQTLDGWIPVRTTASSRGPRQGHQGCWAHTYGLGGREVRETLLRGRGVLAGLPVGQWALLLRCCGRQAEALVRGASLQPGCRPSGPRNARSQVPAVLFEVLITRAAEPRAKVVSPLRIGHSGAPATDSSGGAGLRSGRPCQLASARPVSKTASPQSPSAGAAALWSLY